MEDTTPEIRRIVRDLVMARSEEERFLMCADLHDAGKELATIGMPVGLSLEQKKRYVYRRMHGEDMPGTSRGKTGLQ